MLQIAGEPELDAILRVLRMTFEGRRQRMYDLSIHVDLIVADAWMFLDDAAELRLPVAVGHVVLVVVLLFAIAMVRLIIKNEDLFHSHELGHDTLQHLAFGLERD